MSRKLRPYQNDAIHAIRKFLNDQGSTVAVLPTGLGKCLAKGTPVLMFDGTIRAVEDVRVGDWIMGPDSLPRTILSLARGRELMYRITPHKGDPYTVNASHILSLKMTGGSSKGSGSRGGEYMPGRVINIAVKDYLKRSKTFRHCTKGYRTAIEYAPRPVPLNAYFLGLWLGDGHSYSPTIFSVDPEIHNALRLFAASCGLKATVAQNKSCPSIRINSGRGNAVNPVLDGLRTLGVLNNKHVPLDYKANSRAVRLDVLAGLMDSDGTLTSDGTGYEFASTLEVLADDVVYLARSLGMSAVKAKRKTKTQGGVVCDSYRVHIFGWCCEIPCRIYRKIAKARVIKKDSLLYGFKVEPVGEDDYYGFEIDGDRLFVLGDFTVTHNTVIASRLISEWEHGNTLFLAHTKELISQAADKLSTDLGYRPPVEMGTQWVDVDTIYQGGMCVVASVQTMYGDKRLEKYRKHPFGLIVIDESHHATASTYRKIIDFFRDVNPSVKIVGITATPNRSDKTALGIVFDSEAFQMSIEDAIGQGWLVPIQQEYVVCEAINYDGLNTRKNEFGEADFNGAALEDVMKEESALHAIAKPLVEKAGDRPTLVFCAGVEHAHAMASVLNRYKLDSAKAVDGKTDPLERKAIVQQFADGKLQFLTNCMVFTEGFDAPNCSCIAMARPTKSVSMYTQMLGRGLRPLPGVVDGPPDAFERHTAIFTSDKPACVVLDFVGNSKHKLANVYDVLGGNYDIEVKDLAREEATRQRKPVSEVLEQAKALHDLQRQWNERKHITASGVYHSYDVNPFEGDGPAIHKSEVIRGGCSDGQLQLLVGLGIPYETAAKKSKREAGAMIDKIGQGRCTTKQAATLQRAGIDSAGVGFERAGRIITALKANNWKPLREVPA